MAAAKSIYTNIINKIEKAEITLTSKEITAFRELEKYLLTNDEAPFIEKDIYNAIILMDFISSLYRDNKNKYIVELEMLMKINRVAKTQCKKLYILAFNNKLSALDNKVTLEATKDLQQFLGDIGLPMDTNLLAIMLLEHHINAKTSNDKITKQRQQALAKLKKEQEEKEKAELEQKRIQEEKEKAEELARKEKEKEEALTLLEEEAVLEQFKKEEKKRIRKKQREHDKKANPTFKKKKGSKTPALDNLKSSSLLDETIKPKELKGEQIEIPFEQLDRFNCNIKKDEQPKVKGTTPSELERIEFKPSLSAPEPKLSGTLSLNVGLMNLIQKQIGAQTKAKETSSEKALASLRADISSKEYNSIIHGVRFSGVKDEDVLNSYNSLVSSLVPTLRSIGNLTLRSTKVLEEKLKSVLISKDATHLHEMSKSLELLSVVNLLNTNLTGEKDLDKAIVKSELEIIIENLTSIKDNL